MKYFLLISFWIISFSAAAQYSRELPYQVNEVVEIPHVGSALVISPNAALVAWINDPESKDYGKNISSQLRIKTNNKKPGLFFENKFLKYDFNQGVGTDAVKYNMGHLKKSLIGLRIYLFDRK